MKAKTTLIIATAGLAAAMLGIWFFVLFSMRSVDDISRQSLMAERLMRGIFEQSTITQDYVLHHEQRPKSQWYIQYDQMTRLLGAPEFRQEPSASGLDRLRPALVQLKIAFDELVRQTEVSEPNEEYEAQLAGDVLVRARSVTHIVDELAYSTFETLGETHRRAHRTSFIMLLVPGVLTIVVLVYLYLYVVGSLWLLQKGARAVAGGDLTYRIGSRRDDEAGEVARAFDAMTGRLQESYATLEKKVEDRTRDLRELSQKNQLMLKSIGDGVIAIDRQWNITLWNPAATRIVGVGEQEALGKPFRQIVRFVREHDRKENLGFIEDTMLYGEVHEMSNNTLLLTDDGREVPVGDSAAPILNSDNAVIGAIIVFRDVSTEREAAMLKTDFAYASHQLRTPISRAMWSIEASIDKADGEEMRATLREAEKSVKDIAKMSERLLEVSEIDQGQVTPVFKEIKLKKFLKDLAKKEGEDVEGQKVRLVWPKVPEEATIDADPKLLTKALHEIIQNAIMYSRAGDRVDVELRLEPLNLILRVRDTGIGISEEQAPLLFTKFFRGHNIPLDSVGTGLGLFIARAYIRLMRGKIWFESTLDKGTTFTITLPRVRGMHE